MASSSNHSNNIVTLLLVVLLFLVLGDQVHGQDYEAIIRAHNCDRTKMEPSCAVEIVTTIFNYSSPSAVISNRCCVELKELGQVCHEALSRTLLHSPQHKIDDPTAVLASAGMVWAHCQAVTSDLQAYTAPIPNGLSIYN